MARIACYPGSFNPLTVAHLAVAEAAVEAFGLDRVDLVVSRVGLVKGAVERPRLEDRVHVLAQAAASRPWLGVAVRDEQLIVDLARGYDVVVMGAAVLAKLKAHPKILDRIKYTGRDVATVDLLASLFGVQKVLVGDAVSASDAGAFSDVWGKYVVVAYTELGSQAEMGRPSFGYTYQLGGYPMVSPARYDGDTRTWLYDVADAVQPVIAADLAGYLISAAVA